MDENLTTEEIKKEKLDNAAEYPNETGVVEEKAAAKTEKIEKENNMSGNMPKLKAGSGMKSLDGFMWVMTVLIGTVTGIAGSFLAALGWMDDLQTAYDEWLANNPNLLSSAEKAEVLEMLKCSHWLVNFQGETTRVDMISTFIAVVIILGILFAAGVSVLCVLSGRFKREADGSIHLNLFDRIWSELLLAAGCGSGAGAVALAYPMCELWTFVDVKGIYTPNMTDAYWFGPQNSLIWGLSIIGMALGIAVTLVCFVSVVKKIKARKLIESSLTGKVFRLLAAAAKKIAGSVRKHTGNLVSAVKTTDDFMLKYVGILVGMTILAMTWIGAVVDLILIFIFVPQKVKKFKEIRAGVSEVKDGKLSYKIPVELNKNGEPDTELDILAADINKISDACEIAVKNELKNQRLKTDLISNVSHDLKTPLTSMVSYVDLLKKEGLDSPNAAEYLRILDEKTDRLKILTENLFEAAKASSGAMPVELEEIDLAALVSQSLGETDGKLRARGLVPIVKNRCIGNAADNLAAEVRTAAAGGAAAAVSAFESGAGPKVLADGKLLWRVIENLLGNVSKYALENSRVYIDISREGEMVKLEVKNISKEPLNISSEELTERFTRGDASRNTEGSGLGLAIARDLVKLMNGRFELTIDGDLFKASVLLPIA